MATADVSGQAPPSSPSSWSKILELAGPRFVQAGFDLGAVPTPDDPAFPEFLADLQAADPLLAREVTSTLRRLSAQGRLPSATASKKRQLRQSATHSLFMRREDGTFVLDKRKAPWYGAAALALFFLPMMYLLSKPNLGNTRLSGGASGNSAPAAQVPGSLPGSEDERSLLSKPKPPAAPPSRPTGTLEARTAQASQAVSQLYGEARQDSAAATTAGVAAFKQERAAPQPGASSTLFAPPPRQQTGARPQSIQPQSMQPQSIQPPPRVVSSPVWTAAPGRAGAAPFGSEIQTPPQVIGNTSSQEVGAPELGVPISGNPPEDASALPVVSVFGAAPRSVPKRASAGASVSDKEVTSGLVDNTAPERQRTAQQGADAPPDKAVTSGLVYEGEVRAKAAQVKAAQEALSGAPDQGLSAAPGNAGDAPGALSFGGESGSGGPGSQTLEAQTLAAQTLFGSSATTPSAQIGATGPFGKLEQVSARLVTAISSISGGSVPVIALTAKGGAFIGVATISGVVARVDMTFRRYIAPDGKIYPVDGLAYTQEGPNLTQGLPARIEPYAATLGLDLVQNGASSVQSALQSYLQGLASANGQADMSKFPSLPEIVGAGIASTFKLPSTNQSIVRVAKINTNTRMTIILGLSLGGGE